MRAPAVARHVQGQAIAAWRLLRSLVHVLHGLLVMTRFDSLDAGARHERIRWWSAGVLRHMGMALEVKGTPHAGAVLIVANHISWIDIAAIHAAAPHARFVSKADVLRWPLLGRLISGAGTLFIERERKRDALRVVQTMAAALRSGDTVAVFPEGTTGPGPALLPFHANLLHAAVSTCTPIQPVVLRFADSQGRFSPAVEYIGQTTLLQSLWRIASARGLRAHVELLPAVPSAAADRRALSEYLQGLIATRLID